MAFPVGADLQNSSGATAGPPAQAWAERLRAVFARARRAPRIARLYESYRGALAAAYGAAQEELYEDLFVRHTLLQMAARSLLEGRCGGCGARAGAAVPHLDWWRLLAEEGFPEGFEAAKRVAAGAARLAASAGGLAGLYGQLVGEGLRRRLGEYYTPPWLADFALREFELRGRAVVDPFCGFGAFLVAPFRRKVEEGEDPLGAYLAVAGFDLNPVAVATARAELALAYAEASGSGPPGPPPVYYADTFAALFGGREAWDLVRLLLPGNLADRIARFAEAELGGALTPQVAVAVEGGLADALEGALSACGRDSACIAESVAARLGAAGGPFRGLAELGAHEGLAELAAEYGSPRAWAAVAASALAPALLRRMEPDVVATNPPWISLSEFKAPYAAKMRKLLRAAAREAGVRGAAAAGADVSTVALAWAVGAAREGLAFVVSREQAFFHGSSAPAGVVATYAVLKRWRGALRLIDVDLDAFGHGVRPAVVIAKRGSGTELYVARGGPGYIALSRLPASYEDYVKPGLTYFSEVSPSELAERLGVRAVVATGNFIMGLRGGERGRGEPHAGLILEYFEESGNVAKLRLYNTSAILDAPKGLLEKYGVRAYGLIYVGEIYPFYVRRIHRVLLSDSGEVALRAFLVELLERNAGRAHGADAERVRRLAAELKQDSPPRALAPGAFYVAYRADTAFVAAALRAGEGHVIESHVSALECEGAEQAHYYAAVLNYLAYRVATAGRAFNRHQFARPLLAALLLGLGWGDVPAGVREEVARLARELSAKLPRARFANRLQALEYAARYPEFRRIVSLLDGAARREGWGLALGLVSSSAQR